MSVPCRFDERGRTNGHYRTWQATATSCKLVMHWRWRIDLSHALRLDDNLWRAMSDAALATATRYTWDDATNLFEAAITKVSRPL